MHLIQRQLARCFLLVLFISTACTLAQQQHQNNHPKTSNTKDATTAAITKPNLAANVTSTNTTSTNTTSVNNTTSSTNGERDCDEEVKEQEQHY
jgi:biopolymer transport protein ExbD